MCNINCAIFLSFNLFHFLFKCTLYFNNTLDINCWHWTMNQWLSLENDVGKMIIQEMAPYCLKPFFTRTWSPQLLAVSLLSELLCQLTESNREHIFSVYSVWVTVQTSLGWLSMQSSFQTFSFELPDGCVTLHTSHWMRLIPGEFSDASSLRRSSGVKSGVKFECSVNSGMSI